MIRKKLMLYLFSTFSFHSIAGECVPTSVARVRLSENGIQKVVSKALSSSKDSISKGVESIRPFNFSLAPDKKDCPDFKSWKEMKPIDTWSKCPGLPLLLVNSKRMKDVDDLGRSSPISFNFDEISISKFDLSEAQVECDDIVCDIKLPINKIQLRGDFKASNFFSGKKVLKVKDMTLTLRPKGKKAPYIKIKAKLNVKGEVEDVLSLPPGFLESYFDLAHTSLSVGGREDISEFSLEEMRKAIKSKSFQKKRMDILKEAQRKFQDEEEGRKWAEKRIDELMSSIIESSSQKGLDKTMNFVEGENKEILFYLARMMPGLEHGLVEKLVDSSIPLISQSLEGVVREGILQATKDLPFINKGYQTSLPILNPKRVINRVKINNHEEYLRNQIKKCLSEKTVESCQFNHLDNFELFLKESASLKDAKLLSDLKGDLITVLNLLQNRKIPFEDVKGFVDNVEKNQLKIVKNKESQDIQVRLNIIANQIGQVKDGIDFFVNGCSSGCFSMNLSGINTTEKFLSQKKCDAAVQFDIESFNEYFKVLHRSNLLNMCFAQGLYSHCQKESSIISEHDVRFEKVPKITPLADEKGFQLVIDDVYRKSNELGSSEYTKLVMNFTLAANKEGTGVSVIPTENINAIYKSDTQSLISKVALMFINPAIGPLTEVLHRSVYEDVMADILPMVEKNLERGVSLNDKLPISKIKDVQSRGSMIELCVDF